MDFNKLKEAASSFTGGQGSSNQDSNNNQQQQTGNTGATSNNNNNNNASGQEDYGDKALDFIEQKTGHSMGRDTNEKITDGARNFYEKESGSKIDSKYSN